MASELIEEAITDYFGERCLDYAEGCPTCEAWAEYDRWNTRPAPAATDTGLETVGGEYLDGHTWKPMPAGVTDFALRGFKTRALCDRSQAEELLAAEREAQQRLLDIIEEANDDKEALEADNAALTARIKELDGECNELVTKCNEIIGQRDHALNACAQMEEDKEALEAKLAAANEVAQLVIQAEEDKSGDPNFYILLMQTAYDKARAVLGGKPSC